PPRSLLLPDPCKHGAVRRNRCRPDILVKSTRRIDRYAPAVIVEKTTMRGDVPGIGMAQQHAIAVSPYDLQIGVAMPWLDIQFLAGRPHFGPRAYSRSLPAQVIGDLAIRQHPVSPKLGHLPMRRNP